MKNLSITAAVLACACSRCPASNIATGKAVLGDLANAVTFTLNWENSWCNDLNHDAAWVFVKVRQPGRNWRHARLTLDGHRAEGAPIMGPPPTIEIPRDASGALVFASEAYRGDIAWNLRLSLDATSLPAPNERAALEVQVFAIEVVAIPRDSFFVGEVDPQATNYAAFFRAGDAPDQRELYEVTSEAAIEVGAQHGSLWYQMPEQFQEYGGDQLGPIPAAFPKGFNAFLLMKYEITQGEYAAFLNTLPQDSANFRAINAAVNYATLRGTIEQRDGVFIARLHQRPCNFLSWDDGCAFADWAGLRPMTELEFTKAARGPSRPIDHDYPWGTGSRDPLLRVMSPDDDLATTGEADERLLTDASRDVFGASFYWVMDLAGSVWEKCVTIGHPTGRAFQGSHGDGRTVLGFADNVDWPRGDVGRGGFGYRGGGFYHQGFDYGDSNGFNPYSPTEWRRFGSWGDAPRSMAYGFRCARSRDAPETSAMAPRYEGAVNAGRESVQALMSDSRAPGLCIGVAIDGSTIWNEAFGFADLESGVRTTPDTRFAIGSVSKPLTTCALATLRRDGLLDWDRAIEAYVRDFPHPERGVTPRLIAGHVSGLGDEWAERLRYDARHFSTTHAALQEARDEPLHATPKTELAYATGPYTYLAAAIEQLTGKPLDQAMAERVLGPLGMNSTMPNKPREIVEGRTRFYVRDEHQRPHHAPYCDPSFKLAGAGYLSTTDDLLRFGTAMCGPAFLNEDDWREVTTPLQTSDGADTGYALGWYVSTDAEGRKRLVCPGGGDGISSVLCVFPEQRLVIVALSNMSGVPLNGEWLDHIAAAFLKAKREP